MNKKQEKEFVKLVNGLENCKVKFELENAGWATYEGGICKEILTGAVFFDDNFISQVDPPEDLLDCVRDYIIWSSQPIRDLEAKLALASLFNEKEKENLSNINRIKQPLILAVSINGLGRGVTVSMSGENCPRTVL
jgi:hypothetical protein